MNYHYVKCAGCGEVLKRGTHVKPSGKKKPRCFNCRKKQQRAYHKKYLLKKK